MKLRPALPSDAALLRGWESRPHIRAATGDDAGFDWESELRRDPVWRELSIAEIDGRPIGLMQIIDPAREETRYWGEVEDDLHAIDIWIGEPGDLGRGHSTEMMRLALRRCFSHGAVKAVLSTRSRATRAPIAFTNGWAFARSNAAPSDVTIALFTALLARIG